MNLEMAGQTAWYGGIIAAIIGLIWVILQVSRKGEPLDQKSDEYQYQRKFFSLCWGIASLPVAVIVILVWISPGNTAARGGLGSLLMGFLIPLILSSLESQIIRKNAGKEDISLTSFASIPLAGIGLSLLFIGSVIYFYGINADNLWLSFIVGSALGLFLLRIASNLLNYNRYKSSASKMEAVMFLVDAVLVATILGCHHFTESSAKIFMPVMALMALDISVLLSTVLFSVKPGKKIMKILPGQLAVFLLVFLGLCLFLIIKMNMKIDYNYPIIAGSVTAVVFIVMLYGSAIAVRGADMSTGAMGALLLLGGLWFSYKWGMGFGMSLFTLGLLSVAQIIIPHKCVESFLLFEEPAEKPLQPLKGDVLMQGLDKPVREVVEEQEKSVESAGDDEEKTDNEENEEGASEEGEQDVEETESREPEAVKEKFKDTDRELTWASLFLRGITLAGLTALLFSLFRVFIQKTPLLGHGLDISNGDYSIALLLGIMVSLCFEGFNLMGNNIFLAHDGREGCVKKGLLIYGAGILIGLSVIYSVGVFYRIEGIGAFLLGLSVTAMLGMFTYFAQKKDQGLYRASTCALWVGAASYSVFLAKYKDVPDKLTRMNKQEIIVGMVLLVIVAYFISHYQNRNIKGDAP